MCKEMVVGSNPTRGADEKILILSGFFLGIVRIGTVTALPRARPRAEGRKRDSSLPLAVPAKNSHLGSSLLQGVQSCALAASSCHGGTQLVIRGNPTSNSRSCMEKCYRESAK